MHELSASSGYLRKPTGTRPDIRLFGRATKWDCYIRRQRAGSTVVAGGHHECVMVSIIIIIITNEEINVTLSRKRCRGTLQDYINSPRISQMCK